MSVVLVPRGGTWGATVAAEAAGAGLTPWVLPLIETVPLPSDDLTAATARLAAGEYGWLALTSAAAVPAFSDIKVPRTTVITAVGGATAAALEQEGAPVSLVGSGGAQALLQIWPEPDGGRVLVVQSDIARPVLADGLRAAGWEVDVVVAYRTAAASLSQPEEYAVRTGKADVALVTSGSVARRLADIGVPSSTRLVAMGSQTADDVRAAGLQTAAVAEEPSVEALLAAARRVA